MLKKQLYLEHNQSEIVSECAVCLSCDGHMACSYVTQNCKVQIKISLVIVSVLLKSIFIFVIVDLFLPKREVAVVKTFFYKYDT